MDVQKILEINRHFYESYAKEFSVTRQAPWSGWSKLADFLPHKKAKILDLGCGNGRFYGLLKGLVGADFEYEGVDTSKSLVEAAKQAFPEASFMGQDFLLKNDKYLGDFDLIVGFGIIHHIPSYELRTKFIGQLKDYLTSGGKLILTFWVQKPDEKKLKNNTGVALEKNDFLVEWDSDPKKFRYVHAFDQTEIEKIKFDAAKFGLELINEFSSDGKSGNSNVYLVWRLKND